MTQEDIYNLYKNASSRFFIDDYNVEIEMALSLAFVSHNGQVDKSGEPYIKHVLRVAGSVPYEHMVVALLHDVFEDFLSLKTAHEILVAMPFLQVKEASALELLTRSKDVTYESYIRSLGDNEIARSVKIADIQDHLRDTSNLSDTHIERYKQAFKHLNSIANV